MYNSRIVNKAHKIDLYNSACRNYLYSLQHKQRVRALLIVFCSQLSTCRLESVLINRLALGFRHATNSREDSKLRTTTLRGPPTFAAGSFLGNIDGPIRSLPDEFYDDDDVEEDIVENNALQSDSGYDTISTVKRAASSSSVIAKTNV